MRTLLPFALAVGVGLALAAPSLEARSAEPAPQVVDLRAYLGGVSAPELGRGGVVGVLVPIPRGLARDEWNVDLSAAFATFRSALALEPRYRANACRAQVPAIGAWLSVEAPDELGQAPSEVGLAVTRGARVFSLVGERDSELATSASAPRPGAVGGLSALGRTVIENVFHEGALLDVSGLSEPSFEQALDLAQAAKQPVIASHSNTRALADQPWNLTDAQLRRVAASGGIVGIGFERRLLVRGRPPVLRDVVRQIGHALEIAGEDHVGLGTGFGGGGVFPRDLVRPADLPRLAAALKDAGTSDAVIAKVFAQNARRVLCESYVSHVPDERVPRQTLPAGK